MSHLKYWHKIKMYQHKRYK